MVESLKRKKIESYLFSKIASSCSNFLPDNSTCLDVHGLRKLEFQGRASIMYSFFSTFCLEGVKKRKEFILRVFKEDNCVKGQKEFSLLKGLKKQNLPVPDVYCFEDNVNIFGNSFMIMEKIEAKDASSYFVNEESSKKIIKKMAECLATIHSVNLDSIECSDVLWHKYKLKQRWLFGTRYFVVNRGVSFLGFCPPPQRRFIAAVERLGIVSPKKVNPALIHLDYEPNHVLVRNDRCIVVDWGEASVGDPAYDVSWTYHKLRLGKDASRTDLGNYFVKCYEKYTNQKLENLQFFKDMVAMEMAIWSGLSPFHNDKAQNYRKLLSLIFGDVIGLVTRSMYVHRLEKRMANHHTRVWRNVDYIINYVLRYLEKDRYEQMESENS